MKNNLTKDEARALIGVLRELCMVLHDKEYLRFRVSMGLPLNQELPEEFGSSDDLAGYIAKILMDNNTDPLKLIVKLVKLHDDTDAIGMTTEELMQMYEESLNNVKETKH